MPDWVISVSQLNEYVRKKLASDGLLHSVSVRGEISDLKMHYASGHLYFTLKDDTARIACVMYKTNAQRLKTEIKNGMKVIAVGQAGIYTASGQYQLYTESLKPEGLGDIFERFERLRLKLLDEGLFDAKYKKPIPSTVKTIGVATSATGAAVRDIIRVATNRNPRINILIAPCSVQGNGAENEIAQAVRALDKSGRCDVILVGRGGGSREDLWPFNEEVLARAIFECKTPVISCVGHETDFSISDFVADVRAATPSNGAEIAVNDVAIQGKQLSLLAKRLDTAIKNSQIQRHMRLDIIANSSVFRNAKATLIEARFDKLDKLYSRMKAAEKGRIERLNTVLENHAHMLESLSPERVKMRGYACIRVNGKLVTGIEALKPGVSAVIELNGGSASAVIDEVNYLNDRETEF